MESFWEIIIQPWALRALAAAAIVGIMCGVIGCFVVLRNMALIGDAIAHAILPGVVVAFFLLGYSVLGFFAGAVLAGIFTSLAIAWLQQNAFTKNDAAIGIVFTFMFSLGVIGISHLSRTQGVHLDLKDFLFGNVLGVSPEDLRLTFVMLLFTLLSVFAFYRYLFASTFQPTVARTMGIPVKLMHYFLMLLLSLVVVASLRSVGVILVVAMLITPPSTALLLHNRLKPIILISACIGFASAVGGMLIAMWLETVPGPAMAVTAAMFYLTAVFFAPKKGWVIRQIVRRNNRKNIVLEDALKAIYKQVAGTAFQPSTLPDDLQNLYNENKQGLRRKGWLEKANGLFKLTESGRAHALRLVSAHRLWETYLVRHFGLTPEQIHQDAEKYEHLLTDELLDEMEKHLGFPAVDPHGSPIPDRRILD